MLQPIRGAPSRPSLVRRQGQGGVPAQVLRLVQPPPCVAFQPGQPGPPANQHLAAQRCADALSYMLQKTSACAAGGVGPAARSTRNIHSVLAEGEAGSCPLPRRAAGNTTSATTHKQEHRPNKKEGPGGHKLKREHALQVRGLPAQLGCTAWAGERKLSITASTVPNQLPRLRRGGELCTWGSVEPLPGQLNTGNLHYIVYYNILRLHNSGALSALAAEQGGTGSSHLLNSQGPRSVDPSYFWFKYSYGRQRKGLCRAAGEADGELGPGLLRRSQRTQAAPVHLMIQNSQPTSRQSVAFDVLAHAAFHLLPFLDLQAPEDAMATAARMPSLLLDYDDVVRWAGLPSRWVGLSSLRTVHLDEGGRPTLFADSFAPEDDN